MQSVEGFIYYNARRYDQAIATCRAVLARDPHFLPALHFLLLASERRGGKESEEIAALRRVYADAGRHGERSVSFKRLLDREPLEDPAPYSVAAGLASQGHKEQALAWLEDRKSVV